MPQKRKDDVSRNKKQALQGKTKKRGGKHDDDSDSVDSHGNIRGLIDYEYDSESSYSPTSDSESSLSTVEHPRGRRKAAVKAEKRIKRLSKANGGAGRSPTPPVKPRRLKKKYVAESSSSSSSSEEEDEESEASTDAEKELKEESEEEEEETEDEENSMELEENGIERRGGIVLTFGAGADNRMMPQRYNMKKEPQIVKHFVELLTKPMEDNSIDAQIDQFKALTDVKQRELIEALERRPTMTDKGINLMLRILTLKLPTDIQAMILAKYNALQDMDPGSGEYFKMRNWLDKVVSVPFGSYRDLPVKIDDGPTPCETFMKGAKAALDASTYGQDEPKLQILQYIATKIANPDNNGMSLLLVGPPGIGKTTLIKNGIAKALGWPFQFISLGGDSDASTYTGHQLVYESSHCGKIVNSLVAAKSMSCVMLFDELDKISATPKGEEVQNILIHLTDPAANSEFEDKFLAGIPINLNKSMFIFTANDINKIDRVLLDRMIVIQLKGYDVKQKLAIAENYLLPGALKDVNLNEKVAISKEILQHIIETYAAEEKGVRHLKRCLEQIAQKLNMLRMYNSKELPFHIKDFTLPFVLKKEHCELFLKKSEVSDAPPFGMYC
jgi:ATP-dependent Lon protease